MTAFKTLALGCGVAVASLFATSHTAEAQLGYGPYYGYGNAYGGYGVRNFSYNVTNPNGSSIGYSATTAPRYYGYGAGYNPYYGYRPNIHSTPAFGPGSYSYSYPGVFYTPGSYTFFRN